MREHSTRFTEAHFDAKADRYQAALRSCPTARSLEVLPFLMLLNTLLEKEPMQLIASDMLCGSGILASALRGCFQCVHGVDVSGKMLRYFPIGPGIDRCKASVDEQSDVLANKIRVDVILALAGLHHVYEVTDEGIDPVGSDALQAEVIRGWADALPPGGLMIIADVTAPQHPAHKLQTDVKILQHHNVLTDRYLRYRTALLDETWLPEGLIPRCPDSIKEYERGIHSIVHEPLNANPALWFREVVAKHGLYGHLDHFLNPPSLLNSIGNRSGFWSHYMELPTPWIFPSKESFIYFFYEKFALGPVVDSYDNIEQSVREMISAEAKRFLGITQLENGGIAVGWRLGFYLFKRHGDGPK